MRTLFLLSILSPLLANAATIQLEAVAAYINSGGTLISQLGPDSPGFVSTLDANNFGSISWIYTNTSGAPVTGLQALVFLDADIDRDENTFFNEYGQFVSLTLPAGAPVGAIGATSWQIDEPGFVFGTIRSDLAAGTLTNSNSVSSNAPDDVSLALGFSVGTLAPMQSVVVNFNISPIPIGGLEQIDPDSLSGFHFNGFAVVQPMAQLPPASDVPEPSTWALLAITLPALIGIRRFVRATT